MAYKSVNPFNNETVKTFQELTENEVAAKIDEAQAAYLKWRKTDFATRRQVMKKAASILRDKRRNLLIMLPWKWENSLQKRKRKLI